MVTTGPRLSSRACSCWPGVLLKGSPPGMLMVNNTEALLCARHCCRGSPVLSHVISTTGGVSIVNPTLYMGTLENPTTSHSFAADCECG